MLKIEDFDPKEWIKIVESLGCKNFNLLFGDLGSKDSKIYTYSSDNSELNCVDDVPFFSLSNSRIDQIWDKQRKGEEMFQSFLHNENINIESVFEVLR